MGDYMEYLKKIFKFFIYKCSQIKSGEAKLSISKDSVYTLFRLITHPLDAFNDIKYEGKASLALANIMVALFLFERLIGEACTAYLFGAPEAERMGFWMILATTVGLVLIWSICNWAVSTLFDGEGAFKEIWIMTAYSLLPYLFLYPISVALSYVASSDEAVMLSVLSVIAVGWTLILAFLGMIVCQQFTVSKTVILAVVTALAIFALLFLGLLFFSISQQIVSFIRNLSMEIFL